MSTLDEPVTVLALDGSSRITGVALLRISASGVPAVLAAAALTARETSPAKAGSLTLRVERIADTGGQLAAWVGRNVTDAGVCLDIVAFERGFHQGQAATESHHMCIGRYLTISALVGLPVIPVTVGDVKNRAYNALPGVKSLDAKRRAVVWGRNHLGLALADPDAADTDETALLESEAIADACAVAVASVQILREADAEAGRLAEIARREAVAKATIRQSARDDARRVREENAVAARLAKKAGQGAPQQRKTKVKGGACS